MPVSDPEAQAYDLLPSPVWLSGPGPARSHFNRAWLEFTGRSLQQEMGEGWQQGVHPEDLLRCRQALRKAVARQAAFTLEYRLWHTGGGYRWVVDEGRPRFDAQGRLLGYVGQLSDVTELKLAQQALAASEEEYRSLITNVPGVVYRCTLDRHWTANFVSPLVETLTGYPPEAFTQAGRGLLSLIHADDRARVLADIQAQLAERGSFVAEFRVQDRSGAVHWVLASGRRHPAVDAGGADHLSGVWFDVTPIKAAEERLRQNAIVFDNASEGIAILDAAGRIVVVNRAFTELTGYTAEELQGRAPRQLSCGRHEADFFRQVDSALAADGHWRGEVWMRHKTGQVLPLLQTLSAVRDEQGEVTGYVALYTDISHIKQTEAHLERLAYHDALTGLPNRLLFEQRLQHAIEHAARHGERLAVLYFDLDHFKQLNDSLGHQVGDALLTALAERLKKRLRKSDTLSRRGGDEFTVLLENLREPAQAAKVARDILRQLGKPFTLPGGETVHTGSSIGISLFPDDGREAQQLIERADAAMYEAKAAGGNQYRFYTREVTQASRERSELETRLRNAVEAKALQLVYQPLYDLAEGRLVGVETLLRWPDAELGEVPPERFIPLAEELGLLPDLGEWVLRQACSQALAWEHAGFVPLRVAVNCSQRQVSAADFATRVRAVLADCGLAPDRLELELAEASLLALKSDALAGLQALRAAGVSITVDDFAVGLSALAQLQRLPVDRIKIDRSFVHALPTDPHTQRLVSAIVALARTLRLTVVAEGIETAAQLDWLRAEHCDLAQGFLFGQPLTAQALAALPLHAPRSGPSAA
ncbi:MAG: EAL domain-containing protein [Thiobacillaceae bacterium]|nr:EAL domain-containing protein [Thiobacillaceae bacterium]